MSVCVTTYAVIGQFSVPIPFYDLLKFEIAVKMPCDLSSGFHYGKQQSAVSLFS